MGAGMLLRAGARRHAPVAAAVCALAAAAVFTLALASALAFGGRDAVVGEMDRVGYGDVTLWVSGADADALAAALEASEDVGAARVQPLVFAGYSVGGYHSDDEGQVIAYDPDAYPYAFLDDGLRQRRASAQIEQGQVYVSPALLAASGAAVGDTVSFEVARTGGTVDLVVAGCFEDPFTGSSMVDMKGFLVSQDDYARIAEAASGASSFSALARTGAMIHVQQAAGGALSPLEFDRALGQDDGISRYVELSYSRDTMAGFATLQQGVVAGFLAFFALALVAVTAIVAAHAVGSAVELGRGDLAALKTVGWTSAQLRRILAAPYLAAAAAGAAAGVLLALAACGTAAQALVAATGLLVPLSPQPAACAAAVAGALAVLGAVVAARARAIVSVPPVEAFAGAAAARAGAVRTPLSGRAPLLSLALRTVASAKARYAATCAVAALLVLLVSAVGRINAWVGPGGEGLMDAFSAADHDIGVQPLNPTDMDAVERMIGQYDTVTGVYALAMQPVRVDGGAYTANVIDAPERFHILEGRTASGEGEVVLTRTAASQLGRGVGDSVEVSSGGAAGTYEVVGIYQCANEMGANIGMSLEGYARIGDASGYIWCYHYVLARGGDNEQIAAALQQTFGAAAAVHTNGWSGLAGLVGAMRLMLALIYGLAAAIVFVAVALAAGTLVRSERGDAAVLMALGYTSAQLRWSFALRMGIVAAAGALVGLALSAAFADAAIGALVRLFGIGAFESALGFADGIAPAALIVALAAASAYACSRRIARARPAALFADPAA